MLRYNYNEEINVLLNKVVITGDDNLNGDNGN
jgi:hypothetical protein